LLIAMTPVAGMGVMKSYIYSFIYLQFWPILFVVFNNLMVRDTQNRLSTLADFAGSNGSLNVQNLGPISEVPGEIGATAAVMLSLIPVISGIFPRGISAMEGQMRNILRPYHKAAGSAARQASGGNNFRVATTNANVHSSPGQRHYQWTPGRRTNVCPCPGLHGDIIHGLSLRLWAPGRRRRTNGRSVCRHRMGRRRRGRIWRPCAGASQ